MITLVTDEEKSSQIPITITSLSVTSSGSEDRIICNPADINTVSFIM